MAFSFSNLDSDFLDAVNRLFDGIPDENQTLTGGDGDDTLRGGSGDDFIDGGDGDDVLQGGSKIVPFASGNDTMIGGNGNDFLAGDLGDDILNGGTGNDTLAGHQGNDILNGGTGNDTLQGGYGDDTLNGGQGADLFQLANDSFGPLPGFIAYSPSSFSSFGIDVIEDFNHEEGDKIELSPGIYYGGPYSSGQINYNQQTGALSFQNQQFAQLQPGTDFIPERDIVFEYEYSSFY
ncbi:MAG: calcium-binding protein [Nostocaceae cyanobacterium]|nr:calcium-binding protein [Nostocaceae cyanobacterium]